MQLPSTLEKVSRKFPEAAHRFVEATVAKHEFMQVRLMKPEEQRGDALAVLKFDKQAPEIILRRENLPLHMIFHEVLHLRRFSLLGIPWLVALDVGMRNVAESLVNALEHRHVVPDEIRFFPEAEDYWFNDLTVALEGALRQPTTPQLQRFDLVKAWLVARSVFDGDLLTRYEEALENCGLAEFSEIISNGLEERAVDAERQIACCISLFGFEHAHFRLSTVNGRSSSAEISDF